MNAFKNKEERKNKIYKAIEKKIKDHICRWCIITIKKTNEELLINRTGYRSMEDWDRDTWEIIKNESKELLFAGTWNEMITYINNNY